MVGRSQGADDCGVELRRRAQGLSSPVNAVDRDFSVRDRAAKV